MRLAAIYIPTGILSHLFGEDHKGQTINLGGKYIYEIEENENNINIKSRIENKEYAPNFFGENIVLVSAIVGKNGIGKTSILRAFNQEIDQRSQKLVFFYESLLSDELIIENLIDKKVIANDKYSIIEKNSYYKLYYSPVIDFDLIDTKSPITLVNYFKDNIQKYYLDSIRRNVVFLNSSTSNELKNVYNDSPSYNSIKVCVTKYRKSFFRQVYIESNFANPNTGDSLINEISDDYKNDERKQIPKEEVIDYNERIINHLKSESYTEYFNKLWNLNDYNCTNDNDYIHNSDDFIKNLEITILSYLQLGAVFPLTGLGDKFNFKNILSAKGFLDKLNEFLKLYLISIDKHLYKRFETKLKKINIDEYEEMISIIDKDKFSGISGIDYNNVKERLKNAIEMFSAIKDFYSFLVDNIKAKSIKVKGGYFDINIHKELNIFNELLTKYEDFLSVFKKLPVTVSTLDFIPSKKLSSGEKSLLDFYASIYHYIENIKGRKHHNPERYLLLLDEPELGYHPFWKKKFIAAITKTLPVLFSQINPSRFNSTTKKYELSEMPHPLLQIIFSTHDPLTLSDLPNKNVVYLLKSNDNVTILNQNNPNRPTKTFGANITDLLADSFFVNDGLIGDFAKEKIEKTIEWINNNKKLKSRNRDTFPKELEYHKRVISIIDEPVVKIKLSEMISELEDKNDFQKQILDDEIDFLTKKRDKLI